MYDQGRPWARAASAMAQGPHLLGAPKLCLSSKLILLIYLGLL